MTKFEVSLIDLFAISRRSRRLLPVDCRTEKSDRSKAEENYTAISAFAREQSARRLSRSEIEVNQTAREPAYPIAGDGSNHTLDGWILVAPNTSSPRNHAGYSRIACYKDKPARDQACLFPILIGRIMQFPEWTKPALVGAGAGAIALAIVGFSWGGWMTSSSAAEMSSKHSMAATATALTPYCVRKSQGDPKSTDVLAEIEKASTYQRRGIVEKAGWATPLGAEKPDRALAQACLIALTADT